MENRIYKFRGKAYKLNNAWVYGSLIQDTENNVSDIDWFDYSGQHSFEVIPESIGQFTGLTDRNGKEIFEGDIVHVIYDDGRDLMGVDADYMDYVYFDSDCAGFMIHREHGSDTLEHDMGKSIEIVGNRFENPSLLSQSQPESK